jgi:hypothetical protein
MHRCLGFGIQSPKDYAFVRYVINEKWPYYAYERLGKNDDWRTRKLGRLYMRLANWRQPTAMERDRYEEYWKAGGGRRLKAEGRGLKADFLHQTSDFFHQAQRACLASAAAFLRTCSPAHS